MTRDRWIPWHMAAALAAALLAGAAAKADGGDDAFVRSLTQRITNSNSLLRDGARDALVAIGQPALPALKELARGGDAEAAAAAKELIARIGGDADAVRLASDRRDGPPSRRRDADDRDRRVRRDGRDGRDRDRPGSRDRRHTRGGRGYSRDGFRAGHRRGFDGYRGSYGFGRRDGRGHSFRGFSGFGGWDGRRHGFDGRDGRRPGPGSFGFPGFRGRDGFGSRFGPGRRPGADDGKKEDKKDEKKEDKKDEKKPSADDKGPPGRGPRFGGFGPGFPGFGPGFGPPGFGPGGRNPGAGATGIENALKGLDLTDGQKGKLERLMAEERQAVEKIHEDFLKAVKEILNADQLKKLEKDLPKSPAPGGPPGFPGFKDRSRSTGA